MKIFFTGESVKCHSLIQRKLTDSPVKNIFHWFYQWKLTDLTVKFFLLVNQWKGKSLIQSVKIWLIWIYRILNSGFNHPHVSLITWYKNNWITWLLLNSRRGLRKHSLFCKFYYVLRIEIWRDNEWIWKENETYLIFRFGTL